MPFNTSKRFRKTIFKNLKELNGYTSTHQFQKKTTMINQYSSDGLEHGLHM